jgi:hypothetical protein
MYTFFPNVSKLMKIFDTRHSLPKRSAFSDVHRVKKGVAASNREGGVNK